MADRVTRPLIGPGLIVTGTGGGSGDSRSAKSCGVPFVGWDLAHELRAVARCVPRRYVVIDVDGLVRASGYTAAPTCLPGEPFAIRVASPLAA